MATRLRLVLLCLLAGTTMDVGAAAAQSRDPEHYQLLLRDKAGFKSGGQIHGNVGVTSPRGKLSISHGCVVGDGRELVADSVRIMAGARAFDVAGNIILHTGRGAVIAGTITQPVPAPIYDPEPLIVPDPFDATNFPPAFPIACGGVDRAGQAGEAFELTPGSYGNVSVGSNGRVTLHAGTYQFCSLSVPKYGGIFVEAPATLNVRDLFLVGSSSSFVPMGNPSQIQVNVQGPVARVGNY